eukprot:2249450-Rhodomonas_salina.1
MAPGYKDHDHPIPDLLGEPTGDDGIYLQPMQAVYEKWTTNVCKVLGALRSFWMIPMAITLEFSQGLYQLIIDGVKDDNDYPVFQYIVVAQAIKHCAQQSLPEQSDPLLNA